jgi:hypothetical protein
MRAASYSERVQAETFVAVLAACGGLSAAAYAGIQARAARRSAAAAEELVNVGRRQVEETRRQAQAAEDSVQIGREQLALAREQFEQSRHDVEKDRQEAIEASRPQLVPLNDQPSPGGFNLRITEPLEFSAWFTNQGPGAALVDEVRLDIGDGSILQGSPRAGGGAQPVRELLVPEGEDFNVYVPSSPALTGLVNNPRRDIHLELRCSRAGERSRKWWMPFELGPRLGDIGRHQWIATPGEVRRAE